MQPELVARVTNTGDEPLHRVMVRLESSGRHLDPLRAAGRLFSSWAEP